MRAFCVLSRVVGLSVLLISAAYGQALIEHAVAAAGGSAAGVAGKALSDTADKIFGKVNQQMGQAAATGQGLEKRQELPVLPDGAVAPIPVSLVFPEPSRAPAPVRRRVATEESVRLSPALRQPVQQWQPSLEDLTGVESGISRGELMARLGSPAARVIIPDFGELREIYLFSGDGLHLGTVELTDGSVSTVHVNEYGY